MIKKRYSLKIQNLFMKIRPGPRFEPESRDPQSRRITTYPTPAYEFILIMINYTMMQGQGFEPW